MKLLTPSEIDSVKILFQWFSSALSCRVELYLIATTKFLIIVPDNITEKEEEILDLLGRSGY